MIKKNLYNEVLIAPTKQGANELFIVSGYASATFAQRHVRDILAHDQPKKINLIIGMPSHKSDHSAFLSLLKKPPNNFSGHYFDGKPSVHCKLYSWFEDDNPKCGFSGSANYSQNGFFEQNQTNQITLDNPAEIKSYYLELLQSSLAMPDVGDVHMDHVRPYPPQNIHGSVDPGQIKWIIENKSVQISFLAKDGSMPAKSGLNWGQRENRDPNQAYLSLKLDARKKGFLPERGFTFTLLTDDNMSLDCAVQQDGQKGVSTTDNNSILGAYIRKRLGLKSGAFVSAADLKRYGRTDFVLSKINEETFLFDMSV